MLFLVMMASLHARDARGNPREGRPVPYRAFVARMRAFASSLTHVPGRERAIGARGGSPAAIHVVDLRGRTRRAAAGSSAMSPIVGATA
ncbi:hypothetical protein [Nannocystis bainbridge]|uniref:hypothetical protein n=1 Tax=Nannocystis bainbridge TaxID=2995303 RepID=UPI00232F2FA5|nr:hypothetical protein [Nannocystis bainbridge]